MNRFKKLYSAQMPAISSNGWSRWLLARKILLLGIPLVVGELGSILQQYADTIMVGHYGTIELAAAGFVNSIFYYVIFITLGMSYASTSLIGSAYERCDYKSVFRIFRESLLMNCIVGLALFVILFLLYFNVETIFFNRNIEVFHQPFEILSVSKEYMLMLIMSILPLTLFYACKQYLDGIGKTQASMWVLLFSNVLNIGLNFGFIYGYGFFPELGLMGAGIATLISRIVQLLMIVLVVSRTDIVRKCVNEKVADALTKRGVLEQFTLGLPVSIQLALEIGIFNVCGFFAGWLGTKQLAAHQAMYTISTLFFQVLYGIGAAGTILISYFHSIKAWNNIKRTAKTVFEVGLCIDLFIVLIVGLFFDEIASCFTEDPDVVKCMLAILPCLFIYQFGDCMQITYANALRGIKRTVPLMWITPLTYVLLGLSISYYATFKLNYGVNGVWAGIPIGLLMAGILFRWSFYSFIK